MNVHPDEFGGTDEDSHYCSQTAAVRLLDDAAGEAGCGDAIRIDDDDLDRLIEAATVRFTVAHEEDAKRIAAVLGALGFKPEHVATMPISFRISALADAHRLTPTETTVLTRFVDGASLDKIAIELGYSSIATVNLHMRSIHHKTSTSNEVELLRLVARS